MKAKELIYKKTFKSYAKKEEYGIELELKKGLNGEMMFSFGVETHTIARNGRRVWSSWSHDEDLVEKYINGSSVVTKLHCCDLHGAPSHPVANGMYFVNTDKETAFRYLRLKDEQEYSRLKLAAKTKDKNYFSYMLEKTGITKRWRDEADEAIRFLEKLTGYEFESTKGLSYYMKSLSFDEEQEVERKIAEGLYTEEAIEEAHRKEVLEAKLKKIEKIKEKAEREERLIRKELEIKLYFAENDIDGDEPIYYRHTNEVAFNWCRSSRKPWTQEMFDAFMARTDKPEGVKYVLNPIETK